MFNLTLQGIIPENYQDKITDLESVKSAFQKLYDLIEIILKNINFNTRNLRDNLRPLGTLQSLEATDRIPHPPDTVEVEGKNGAVTLTSTPTISDGYAGERLLIIGTHDTRTLTLQDNSSLSGSNLQLSGAANRTLGANDTLYLVFSPTNNEWVEIANAQN